MRRIARTLIILIALAEGSAWTYLIAALLKSLTLFAGGGDDAGGRPGAGTELFGQLIVGAMCLFIASPYICMVVGSLHLITGKELRIAHTYSLAILSIMTFFLCVFSFQIFLALRLGNERASIRSMPPLWISLALMAVGNIVAGGLWAFYFREAPSAPSEPTKPQTPG
jgi:uncharacterized membrane protein